MLKRLEVIQSTRRGHNCTACGKRTRARVPAIALVIEYDKTERGRDEKDIIYFCDIECYNNFEALNVYSAEAGRSCTFNG